MAQNMIRFNSNVSASGLAFAVTQEKIFAENKEKLIHAALSSLLLFDNDKALEAKLPRVGDVTVTQSQEVLDLTDSQQADGQWLVERIVAREAERDANGRWVYLVRFQDPERVWPVERTTSVSPARASTGPASGRRRRPQRDSSLERREATSS